MHPAERRADACFAMTLYVVVVAVVSVAYYYLVAIG